MEGMITKSFEVSLDSDEREKGAITALVVPFHNVDKQGDRIVPGAYTKSLQKWRASGRMIPMVYAHQWKNPMNHIGYWDPNLCEEVEETINHPAGLKMKGFVDVGQGNPIADWIYRLMSTNRISQFSQGFLVPHGGEGRNKTDHANDIREIDLIEAGPTMAGVNPDTLLLQLKSVDTMERSKSDADLATSIKRIIMALEDALKEYSGESDGDDDVVDMDAFPPAMSEVVEPMPAAEKSDDDVREKTDDVYVDVVDWDPFDGDRALERAEEADDPEYAMKSICAGMIDRSRADSLRSSFRLAHHAEADGPPNANAVEAALARIEHPATKRLLVNYNEAKAHLLAHKRDIDVEAGLAVSADDAIQQKAIQDYLAKASLELLAEPSDANGNADYVPDWALGTYNSTTTGRMGAKIHELEKAVRGMMRQNSLGAEEADALDEVALRFKSVGQELLDGSRLQDSATIARAIRRGEDLRNDIDQLKADWLVGDSTRMRLSDTLGDPILKAFNTYLQHVKDTKK